jgi:hypothetical protein
MHTKADWLASARSTGKTGKAQETPAAPSQSADESKRGKQFVQITAAQARRLRRVTNATTLQIYLHLHFLAPYGKAQGKPFELPTGAAFGFNRDQWQRAVTELKKCGLISVQPRRGSTPLITMLAERVVS